jgi:myo-inositol 2-dehydrogenase/D-chiro-inositol 1-dehydrogenase
MTLRIGVVGTGNIGTYHARRIATEIAGAEVTALFDVTTDRVTELATELGAAARPEASAVIDDPEIDAVVIASPGHLHADQVLACIAAGKPVLCEKPLATTTEDCLKVVEAEVASGRQLVQVGFMRRYDAAYRQMKAALEGDEIGEALLMHCVHRNPMTPETFTREMALTDSVIHEIDTTRWLLNEEITAVSFRAGKRTPGTAVQDPQIVMLETTSGVLVDVESFVRCQYGYDVRCELVGSQGLATLHDPAMASVVRAGQRAHRVPEDWRARFGAAFHTEIQSWVHSVETGDYHGASAWDGYAATAVAEAGLTALAGGETVQVQLADRPAFYDGGTAR